MISQSALFFLYAGLIYVNGGESFFFKNKEAARLLFEVGRLLRAKEAKNQQLNILASFSFFFLSVLLACLDLH
jgi:hypothetical protein